MDNTYIIKQVKDSGLRITKVRVLILKLLYFAEFPMTVQQILVTLNANKTTIYREMETLEVKGFIVSVSFDDGVKRYELSNLGHHHHLVCLNCNTVKDLMIADDFHKEEKQISTKEKFTVLKHNLDFYGICAKCN